VHFLEAHVTTTMPALPVMFMMRLATVRELHPEQVQFFLLADKPLAQV
jgi:hypothetical protein